MMIRRMTALLLVMMLLPVCALAEVRYEVGRRWICRFPDYDQVDLKFVDADTEWIFVDRDNLDEHLDVVLRRGDSEEQIRARFADENLLFEAYSTLYLKDCCIRLYRFENEYSREIGTLDGLKKDRINEIAKDVRNGLVVPGFDFYNTGYIKESKPSSLEGHFYSSAESPYETGVFQLFFVNGRMYMLQFNCYGRQILVKNQLHDEEYMRLTNTPIRSYCGDAGGHIVFNIPLQARPTQLKLTSALPKVMILSDLQVTGEMEKGASLAVTLDGQPVEAKVDTKGKFSFNISVREAGEHKLTLTASHPKCSDRVREFTLLASPVITPLTISDKPDPVVLVGRHDFAGTTDPGAKVTFVLNSEEPVEVTADAEGRFGQAFDIADDGKYTMTITAQTEGKEPTSETASFLAQYKNGNAAIKAFKKKGMTETSIYEIAKDPEAYVGERVMLSVKATDVYAVDGSGIVFECNLNQAKNVTKEAPKLYLTGDSYSYEIIGHKSFTVYGTVMGEKITTNKKTGEEEKRIHIEVEAGTWLEYRYR